MTPLLASAMTEVRSLHEAFEDLFTGRSRDLGRCAKALAMDFSMVAPDGSRLNREAVLGVLGAADPLLEGERHVVHRLHQLRVHSQEEGMPEVRVVGAVEDLGDGIFI